MSQLGVLVYPGFLAAADITLAGVLFLRAPVLGVLMAAVALAVAAVIALQAREHPSFAPQPEMPHDD
jgi:hypothetical protein